MTTWGNPAGSPARTTPARTAPNRGGAGPDAELVLVSGKIRTPAHPSGFVQAAAISGGVVVALGSDEDIRGFVRPFTRVINLRGRLAIPAFGDAHVHPVQGGLESMRCNLAGLRPGGSTWTRSPPTARPSRPAAGSSAAAGPCRPSPAARRTPPTWTR